MGQSLSLITPIDAMEVTRRPCAAPGLTEAAHKQRDCARPRSRNERLSRARNPRMVSACGSSTLQRRTRTGAADPDTSQPGSDRAILNGVVPRS